MSNSIKEYEELSNLAVENYSEDEEAFTRGIDIGNVPASSQEALLEILGHEEGDDEGNIPSLAVRRDAEDLTEDDFAAILQNIVISDDGEMMEHVIDAACDCPTKNEAYTDNTLSFISNPKNAKSRKLYEKYQSHYLTYCNKEKERNPETEVTLCNYFSMLQVTRRYTAGNFWCIYSTLKTFILARYQVDIKMYPVLKKLMKKLTEDHIKSKPDVFLYSEIKHGLEKLFDEDEPKDLMYKVGISIMYYGVLRRCEILVIQINNVTIAEVVRVDYPYPTKRRVKGFKFVIPEWLVPTFQKYVDQINPDLSRNERFMLNYNTKSCRRTQNMGVNNVANMAPELAQRLGKPNTNKFTAKSFRRSAATQLVEAGISIVGLCEAGNWKSVSTAREYTEYSTVATDARMSMLDGNKRPNDEYIESPVKTVAKLTNDSSPKAGIITNTNCTIININNATTIMGLNEILYAAKGQNEPNM